MKPVPEDVPSRRLFVRDGDFHRLKPMLQAGVGVRVKLCRSLRQFLTADLGFDAAYVDSRLQTLLLDGAPVDDLEKASVSPGCVLALSGAMPGLAGATMRRGGYYARMREGIAHDGGRTKSHATEPPTEHTVVSVKLFNRALEDLGRDLVVGRPLLVDRHWLTDLSDLEDSVTAGSRVSHDMVWLTVILADGQMNREATHADHA